MKKALVCGGGGFIGHHLIKRLKAEGYWVLGIDTKQPQFEKTQADNFLIYDLRYYLPTYHVDEVYQLAANMGGIGYITKHDSEIMCNNTLINFNVLNACKLLNIKKIFFSSSACIYTSFDCIESNAYPAIPDTEYGWEKLYAERLYQAYARDYGLDIRIARFHNIYGPLGTYDGGREKAPAALCRKVALAKDGDEIEVWGNGQQVRTFLYIDECIEGIRRLMCSKMAFPVNIGSEEEVIINVLTQMIIDISGKKLRIKNIDGPTGVLRRVSNNDLIQETIGWRPNYPLRQGIEKTYAWINSEIQNDRNNL